MTELGPIPGGDETVVFTFTVTEFSRLLWKGNSIVSEPRTPRDQPVSLETPIHLYEILDNKTY